MHSAGFVRSTHRVSDEAVHLDDLGALVAAGLAQVVAEYHGVILGAVRLAFAAMSSSERPDRLAIAGAEVRRVQQSCAALGRLVDVGARADLRREEQRDREGVLVGRLDALPAVDPLRRGDCREKGESECPRCRAAKHAPSAFEGSG
jgi:hypothetical protein